MNIQEIQTFINIVLASGFIGQFIFFRSKRRKSESEANLSEVEVKTQEFDLEKLRLEHAKKELAENYLQLDELQKIINELRTKLNNQSNNIFNLEQSLIIANNLKCTQNDCDRRTPPNYVKDN